MVFSSSSATVGLLLLSLLWLAFPRYHFFNYFKCYVCIGICERKVYAYAV
jgi:hypothetical protein